ncbi:FkbM family methyltransferase [Aurantimonas sp. A2-1-M11]
MTGAGMAVWRGWSGIARSLAVYHGDGGHLSSLGDFYRDFVRPGDLVFDIGAHVGDRTRIFHRLGARVVAVEPQPRLAALLWLAFGWRRRITIVAAAVSDAPGEIRLHVNHANPTVTTGSDALVAAATGGTGWQDQVWDGAVIVPATTLDALIAAHGRPDFIKIDVEGLEDRVLAGLGPPVPILSFEFTTLQRDVALAALDRAAALGYRRFKLSIGESHAWETPAEESAPAMAERLARLPEAANSGDVYCFLDPA